MSDDGDAASVEDDNEDEELMQDIIQSIAALKQEKPPTPPDSPEPVNPEETTSTQPQTPIDLDSLSISELRVLLDQVKEASNYNNQLQGILLMKEVKLLSIKRQLSAARSDPQKNKPKDDMRTDVGRYYVRFKAPYFKNIHNFAGYVIVPESQLPATAQRYETPSGQWNKAALIDLEYNVRLYLAHRKSKEMLMINKPRTIEEKEKIIETYNHIRKKARLASIVNEDFEEVIDWCSVASKLKKDFSPNECQKAWNIFLKPGINKKKWTVAEKENLKRLAMEHNYEDWDAIAFELGTNRNGYACFHVYVDKIMKLAEGEWSQAEENFLTKLVKQCSYGEKVMWHKVAYFFETRTTTQLYRKWTLSCVGKEVVAGAFTEEEDRTIIEMLLVRKGEFTLGQVAKKLNRITSQIRYRFGQLKSSMKHKYGEWSLQEDKLLMDLVERFGQKSWSSIAEHMPDRGRVQIRHRYTNIMKRLNANPLLTLETLPRFKRPVHSKRKETNLKWLMELSGIEEPPPDGTVNDGVGTTVQSEVEQIIGSVRKRKRKQPLEPMAILSPSRYPDFDEGGAPIPSDKGIQLNTSDIPLSPRQPERDPLELQSPERPAQNPESKPTTEATRPNRRIVLRKEPQEDSNRDELEIELKPRLIDLYNPIVEYYTTTSDFIGDLRKPPPGPKKRPKAETLNAILKFTPYKYFDPKNAEWTYKADKTDPYMNELFNFMDKRESDNERTEEPDKILDNRLLPPNLTNFEGFYNLLVDMGITENDIQASDDALDEELKKLYCQDDETIAAVNRWNTRLASLFSWPAALSSVTLELEDSVDAKTDDADDGPSTSRHRSRSKPENEVVKTEPVCDECS